MTEKVAIIGSRRGADLGEVRRFVRALHAKQPDTILVSGGAEGVDKAAETEWHGLGGRVLSFRPKETKPGTFGVEVWRIGKANETSSVVVPADEPTFSDWKGAAFYRDSLIAERADRVVAFFAGTRTPGTQVTLDFAHAYRRDIYEFGLRRAA